MIDKRRLAVIIPCYNKVYYTQKTIESLIEATSSDLFVILVDDGSADETLNYSFDVSARMNKVQQRFIYHKNQTNIGVNGSWNVGLEIALALEAPYICIANNDLFFSPGWDTALLNALDGEYSLVSPYSTEQVIPSDWPQGSGRHVNPVDPEGKHMDILGACFMFKRDLIHTIGYFPTPPVHYFGDNFINDQTKLRGMKVGHIRESYIHHFFCQTTRQLDNNKWFKLDGDAYQEFCRNFKMPAE